MRFRSSRTSSGKPESKESAASLARFFLVLVIVAWTMRSFILQPFSIPSGSMLPTLYIGDYLLVAKWPYGFSRYSFPFEFPPISTRVLGHLPERGDVVVFRLPTEESDLIKRVIGLPGDTVEMRLGELVLNGAPVPRRKLNPVPIPITENSPCRTVPPAVPATVTMSDRSYCVYSAYLESLPGGPSYTTLDQLGHGPADDFGPVRVPPGHLFLMGDNRDDSLDSRFPASEGGVGMLAQEDLVGRALVTFWSTNGSAAFWEPWTWFTALRVHRIGNRYTGAPE